MCATLTWRDDGSLAGFSKCKFESLEMRRVGKYLRQQAKFSAGLYAVFAGRAFFEPVALGITRSDLKKVKFF
jgi:hypothetical protein